MATGEILRNYFVPGEGIDRRVITADIQRYLGSDATVRPGPGTGEHEGIAGYWVKAYRGLTSAMVADLKADSARWRQEQNHGNRGTKRAKTAHNSGSAEPDSPTGPYETSHTRYVSNVPEPSRGHTDSPGGDRNPYGAPPLRTQQDPYGSGYDAPRPVSGPGPGYGYQPPQPPRDFDQRYQGPMDGRPPYGQEPPMSGYYNQPPSSSSYDDRPRYAPSGYGANNEVPPHSGPGRPAYAPVSMYDAPPNPGPGADRYRQPMAPTGYSNGAPPPNRDPTGYRPQEFGGPPGPSNVYPSPAMSIPSVSGPPQREPITSPPSMYNNGQSPYDPQYDRLSVESTSSRDARWRR